MSGFENDVMVSKNMNFDNSGAKPHLGIINAAGKLPIGTGNLAPTPEILAGTLVSPLGTITIGYSSPNITIEATGGASTVQHLTGDTGGTLNPVANNFFILGSVLAPATTPVQVNGSGNTLVVNIQRSQAIAAADMTKVGLSNFDSARFTVTATGFVSLNGAGVGETITGQSGGALSPTAGNWNISGASTAAGTSPVVTSGSVSTLTVNVQKSQAIAGTDATKIGLAAFDSADFTVDANGFVSAATTGFLKTLTGDSGGARPPTANNINIIGGTSAAGTTPVAVAGATSTLTVNVQTSQALAAADATKIGLSNFDSASFAVAATGFVTLSTTGVGKTITGDSGGALSPTANNWNIVGLSGSKTSGSGSTLTVKSPPFSQVGSSATSSLNTGEFVTAAVTRTLPASAGLADGDLFIYVCTTASALIIQSVTAQKIRIGNQITSAAGSATSNAIGDSIALRFNATDGFFYAVSVVGNWTLSA